MKKYLKPFMTMMVLMSALFLFSVGSSAENAYEEIEDGSLSISDITVSVCGQKIKASNINGETYVFMPSSASLSSVILGYKVTENAELWVYDGDYSINADNAKSLNISSVADYDKSSGHYDVTFRVVVSDDKNTTLRYSEKVIHFMKSENTASMFITVKDPAYSRAWIESSPNHSNDAGKYTTVNMYMEDADSTVIYDGKLSSLKGRGNTTWTREKKPYQIKLNKKADLLNSGNDANVNKTWVLLANALDKTLMKNALAFDLARYLGCEETPEYRFAELYFDGEYRGSYVVCEKVQINSGRVDIAELEEHNTVDDEAATAQATNKYGLVYQYNPTAVCDTEDIYGGYLLEQDSAFYSKENSWFKTSSGAVIVVKSPEFATKEQMEFISEYFEEMYRSTRNDSFNGKMVYDYIDLDSLAAVYMVNEYTKNCDFCASSTYFFLPEKGNEKYEYKFYAGPAWDFDTSLGNRTEQANWMQDPTTLFRADSQYFRGSIVKSAIKNKAAEIGNVYDVLFAGQAVYDEEKGVYSLEMYRSLIDASQKMNFTVWPFDSSPNTYAYPSYIENYEYVYNFIKTRHENILPIIASWNVPVYDDVVKCANDEHPDKDYNGKCDICGEEIQENFFKKLIRKFMELIFKIKNMLADIFG